MPDSTLMEHDHEKSQPRQRTRERIPCYRFEIKGEAFMIVPYDDEEPKAVNEALSSPKAMEEEMESLKTNQVWDLVDLSPG